MHFLSTHYHLWSWIYLHFTFEGKLRPRDEGSDLIMATVEDKESKPKLAASRALFLLSYF